MRLPACLLAALLFAAPLLADEPPESAAWSVYVNGVQNGVNTLRHNGHDWFDAQQLAAALGAQLNVGESGFYVNGQQLQQPVVLIGSLPFTTAEAMAKTLSATVQRDPVKRAAYFQLAKNNPEAIPYYSADYVTPAEQNRRQRAQDLSLSPGDQMLEEWDEHMAEEWRKKHPWMPYVPRGADYTQLRYDSKEFKGPVSDEEMLANTNTYRQPKAEHRPTGYLSRSANNGVFSVTLTDVKLAEALKGLKPPLMPEPGNKFLVVHLRLENVSKSTQRPGWFAMRDQNGTAFLANNLYSQFSQGELRSRQSTSGYLIFEIPMAAQPTSLEAQVTPALNLSLIYR
jgi:hypothetical protein